MRIIICGGRDYNDGFTVWHVLRALDPDHVTIVHGDCPTGADAFADRYATAMGFEVDPNPADWQRHGKAAGPIRNQAMLDAIAHLVIAFPGERGTADMVGRARSAGVPVLHVDGGGA